MTYQLVSVIPHQSKGFGPMECFLTDKPPEEIQWMAQMNNSRFILSCCPGYEGMYNVQLEKFPDEIGIPMVFKYMHYFKEMI